MNRIIDHPILSAPEGRETVNFTFDGTALTGYKDEAVSSALFAAGIQTFSVHPRGDAPQGIFCANGQCSQCTVLIDGVARKACITPLAAGMDVRTLHGFPELPARDAPRGTVSGETLSTDVLVIGGGPSGLAAAAELA
ncbi:MAG: sulfurtransferase, partial [Treponema sp.]|nr:sulfurtransferase [Treponema sp.]